MGLDLSEFFLNSSIKSMSKNVILEDLFKLNFVSCAQAFETINYCISMNSKLMFKMLEDNGLKNQPLEGDREL